MESPDSPWAVSHDDRIRKRFDEPPSRGVIFFLGFLRSKGINSGRLVDIGCGTGRNAIYLAQSGFEVHALDRSDDVLKDIDLHGVMPHCHSATDCWLFEDAFFDLAMDIFCYSEQADQARKAAYRDELRRVLKSGGYYLISVPSSPGAKEAIAKEFDGFEAVASTSSEDRICGKPVKTLNLVMRKK
jgi:SAM-dependent methyltransferase